MTQIDCSAITRIWNATLPARYQIDEQLVAFNCLEGGLVVDEATFVEADGFVVVKRGVGHEPVAHVSCFGGECADAHLQSRLALVSMGFQRWQFGGDMRHFFPGVPLDWTGARQTLTDVGMVRVGASVFDVERDLGDYSPPVEPSAHARLCTFEDAIALDEFFAGDFPGRWRSDVTEKFKEDPSRIVALFMDGSCEGFAMLQMEGDAHRRAGAVWSASLGPNWAALGPIGVSKSVRGQGHGHALLAWSLAWLRDQGVRRTVIDWTTLVPFYGRHGFEPAREYVTYAGPLK